MPPVGRSGNADRVNVGTRGTRQRTARCPPLRSMDIEPLPGVLAAIERGRGRRSAYGSPSPWVTTGPAAEAAGQPTSRWSRIRATVVTLRSEGWSTLAIGDELGISRSRVQQLILEACDAILRALPRSREADQVCAPVWQRWCDERGDAEACARV